MIPWMKVTSRIGGPTTHIRKPKPGSSASTPTRTIRSHAFLATGRQGEGVGGRLGGVFLWFILVVSLVGW